MFVVLIIAALILIGVVILIIRRPGRPSPADAVPDRFHSVGPGEAKPRENRATGPN